MNEIQRYEIAHYQRQSRKCYEAATEIIRRSLDAPLYGACPNSPSRWLPMWEDAARWRERGNMWAVKARELLFNIPERPIWERDDPISDDL